MTSDNINHYNLFRILQTAIESYNNLENKSSIIELAALTKSKTPQAAKPRVFSFANYTTLLLNCYKAIAKA
jgi:hypothetical protein